MAAAPIIYQRAVIGPKVLDQLKIYFSLVSAPARTSSNWTSEKRGALAATTFGLPRRCAARSRSSRHRRASRRVQVVHVVGQERRPPRSCESRELGRRERLQNGCEDALGVSGCRNAFRGWRGSQTAGPFSCGNDLGLRGARIRRL